MYEHLNASARIASPLLSAEQVSYSAALKALGDEVQSVSADKLAVVFTAQYTNEEYTAVLQALKKLTGGMPKVFVWRDESEKEDEFDGILMRGDRNPNTRGMNDVLKAEGVKPAILKSDYSSLASSGAELTLVFGPEVESAYPNMAKALSRLAEMKKAVYFGNTLQEPAQKMWLRMPVKVFSEKSGTFVNFNGVAQKLKANAPVFPAVKCVSEYFGQLSSSAQSNV
jgi:NADH-quinone oxidoreductase subunit G